MEPLKNNRNLYLIPLVVVILGLTLMPNNGDAPSIPYVDKLVHFLMYFGLALNLSYKYQKTKHRVLAVVSGGLMGVVLELIQHFIPGRDMSFIDGVANGIGLIFGWLFYIRCRAFSHKVFNFLKA